jgi:hypothetical protein
MLKTMKLGKSDFSKEFDVKKALIDSVNGI